MQLLDTQTSNRGTRKKNSSFSHFIIRCCSGLYKTCKNRLAYLFNFYCCLLVDMQINLFFLLLLLLFCFLLLLKHSNNRDKIANFSTSSSSKFTTESDHIHKREDKHKTWRFFFMNRIVSTHITRKYI